MFERRRVDIKCLQEVRYRGQGARVYGGEEKCEFWWSGSEEGRNGVAIMVKEDQVEEVIEVTRWDVFTVLMLHNRVGLKQKRRSFLQ